MEYNKSKQLGKTYLYTFDNLYEFYTYCNETPFNEVFCNERDRQSIHGSERFTGTSSYKEAVDLMRNGWTEKSEELTKTLKALEGGKVQSTMKLRDIIGVQGYQPIIPNYLNNQPNAMVRKQMQPVKQRVITLNKAIDYNSMVSTETIVAESIKALQVIKKLEAQGLRINLNLLWAVDCCSGGKEKDLTKRIAIKIKLKNANEKLNISKLTYPLVHSSMLRRLVFRFLEVCPDTPRNILTGYGWPSYSNYNKVPDTSIVPKGEYYIPAIWNKEVKSISSLSDI